MSVTAISPIDGRYEAQTADLASDFSEAALIKYRVRVEIEWLLFMSERSEIAEVRTFARGGNDIAARAVYQLPAY